MAWNSKLPMITAMRNIRDCFNIGIWLSPKHEKALRPFKARQLSQKE